MKMKRFYIGFGVFMILIVIMMGIGSYANVSEEHQIDKKVEKYIKGNKEKEDGYKAVDSIEEKRKILKNYEDISKRDNEGNDDIQGETWKYGSKIKDGLYITYDSTDKEATVKLKNYIKNSNRPQLHIMNKGMEQEYITFYPLYSELVGKQISTEDFPYAFYVVDGELRKEYSVEDVKKGILPEYYGEN